MCCFVSFYFCVCFCHLFGNVICFLLGVCVVLVASLVLLQIIRNSVFPAFLVFSSWNVILQIYVFVIGFLFGLFASLLNEVGMIYMCVLSFSFLLKHKTGLFSCLDLVVSVFICLFYFDVFRFCFHSFRTTDTANTPQTQKCKKNTPHSASTVVFTDSAPIFWG